MLHIIIFILKIIGILLLVILGLILLLVSSVLFVPITYKVRAERKDGVIQVRAVAGWMFRLLSVHYRLHTSQEPMQLLQGRILGIPVWKPLEPKKEKPKKTEKKSKEKQSKPKQMEAKQLEQKAEVKSSDKAKERLKKDLTPGTAVATVPQPEPEVSRQEQPQDKKAQTKPPRQSILKKLLYAIRRIYGKITAIGRGLFSLVVKLLHMPEKASETIGTLTDFWNLEENVKARESIWRELKFLWKHSRPRKADLTLHFGFEDPSWTGQCMGVLSILNVWYPGSLNRRSLREHFI